VSLTHVGSLSVGGAVSGIVEVLDPLQAALGNAKLVIGAQVTALASFKATIRALALVDLEAQLNATLQAVASLQLSVSDPSVYLSGLVSGIIQVQANISALVPAIALSGQLSASLALQADLEAKIAAFDLALNALVAISAALSAVLQVALPALDAYAAFAANLSAGSVDLYVYDGTLSGFASAAAALSGSATVRAVMVIADTANASATAGVNAVFGI
jgi:hypothetical protein